MIYILKILSKNNSKIRLSFYLPWIGIFIGTVFLLLINSIMDGMENEIFTNLNDNDQLDFRLNYLKIPIGKYDIGLSESFLIYIDKIMRRSSERRGIS